MSCVIMVHRIEDILPDPPREPCLGCGQPAVFVIRQVTEKIVVISPISDARNVTATVLGYVCGYCSVKMS